MKLLTICPIANPSTYRQTQLSFRRGYTVEKNELVFVWDKTFFEKKITLFTNLQMGFVGAALMLMMMDLSKLYLLAPLVVGLILASWYKHHIDSIKNEVKDASIQFAPKSILVTLPEQEIEKRITFREIEEIESHKENFITIVTIYLRNGEDKLELKAFAQPEQLTQKLNSAIIDFQAELEK